MLEAIFTFFKALSAFLISIGINPSHFIAGFAGAFVRNVIQGKKLTWEMFAFVMVGALCATYLTPLVVMYLALANTPGLAFGIGLIGMSFAEGAVKLAHQWGSKPKLPKGFTPKDIAEVFQEDDDKL